MIRWTRWALSPATLLALIILSVTSDARAQCAPGGEHAVFPITLCPGGSDSITVRAEGWFGNLCWSYPQTDSLAATAGGIDIWVTELHQGYSGCFQAISDYRFDVKLPPMAPGTYPVRLHFDVVPLIDSTEYEGTYTCTSSVFVPRQGDLNGDGILTLADIIQLVNYVFKGATAPSCGVADVNCNGAPSMEDILRLVDHALRSGSAPPLSCN